MKAKEYLMQIKKLDRLVENKLVELEQWKALATSVTQQLTPDKVQTSGNQQKMADAVCKIIEIEAELDVCIDRLVDTRKEITKTLERLNAGYYDILHKVYVQGQTLDEYALHNGKTYGWAKKKNSRALKRLQNVLDTEEGRNAGA